jgi:Phosphodiester glycosidase
MSWTPIPYATALLALLGLATARIAWRRSRGRPIGPLLVWRIGAGLAGLGSILALATAGWTFWYTHRPQPLPTRSRLFEGVHYIRDVRQHPRPLVIHVIRVDLDAPGLEFLVTPGDPGSARMLKARTTTGFLDEFGLQIAINTNYFYPFASNTPWDYYPKAGEPVDVCGIAASRGRTYSPSRWKDGTLYLSADNRASIDRPEGPIFNAIAGNGLLVKDGRSLAPFEDADLYPRAALALDRPARTLILVAIDGKQPNYSEGATLEELAAILLEYGGHDAIRLDEGGSATLAAKGPDGRPLLLNCPINSRIPGFERPVANHLGLYARP